MCPKASWWIHYIFVLVLVLGSDLDLDLGLDLGTPIRIASTVPLNTSSMNGRQMWVMTRPDTAGLMYGSAAIRSLPRSRW